MAQTSLYATKYAYLENDNVGNSHSETLQPITGTLKAPLFLMRFPAFPDELKYRSIQQISLSFGVDGTGQAYVRKQQFVADDFNDASVTYETAPTSDETHLFSKNMSAGTPAVGTPYNTTMDASFTGSDTETGELIRRRTCILQDFLLYYSYSLHASSSLSIYTPLFSGTEVQEAAFRPHLIVSYSDADVGVSPFQPQHPEYINPHIENTIRWNYNVDKGTAAVLEVTAETFYWKEHSAANYTAISLTPGAKEVTIPAETFPGASSIDYYVSVTCNSGVTTSSDVLTSSTADSLATATPLAPISSVEASDSPIRLQWTVENASGSVQTKSELQYSTDEGVTWTALTLISGSATYYDVPANTFPTGPVNWRVRAYNIDDVAGSWGEASFVALAAPPAPSVLSDAVPFATITWQSTGQQAYQIEVDGQDLGTFFGTGKEYKFATPLSDGEHTVRVRVQNLYGMWSQYGSAMFTVENTPGADIALEGVFGVDADLGWFSGGSVTDFLIFRDGALIGHTDGVTFVDRYVLGTHSYFVINRLPSGNYSKSNTVTGLLGVERPMIAAFSGGDWIPMKYSERSIAEQRFNWNRTHSLRHIAGAKFPVLEMSPYEDFSGSYDVAFLDAAGAAAFEALLGQVVILKSREGKVVIGALTDASEVVNSFYLAYQFVLEQIHWEDFIDDENG